MGVVPVTKWGRTICPVFITGEMRMSSPGAPPAAAAIDAADTRVRTHVAMATLVHIEPDVRRPV